MQDQPSSRNVDYKIGPLFFSGAVVKDRSVDSIKKTFHNCMYGADKNNKAIYVSLVCLFIYGSDKTAKYFYFNVEIHLNEDADVKGDKRGKL